MRTYLTLKAKSLLGKLTTAVLGKNVSGLLVHTSNGDFVVAPGDQGVGRHLRIHGHWGLEELARLEHHLASDTKVLVVGAHIGTLAIPIAKIAGEVFAIEANPVTYKLLVQNIALNSSANCKAFNVAASDRREEIRFLLSRTNSGGSKRTPKRKEFVYYYDHPEEISVQGDSLDDLFGSVAFDVIVMDIEGSEYAALKGMQRILSRCRLLIVEFVPHHLANVSGVSVEEFLSTIAPHFSTLTIPSKGKTVASSEFLACLNDMYVHGQIDDGILFSK